MNLLINFIFKTLKILLLTWTERRSCNEFSDVAEMRITAHGERKKLQGIKFYV